MAGALAAQLAAAAPPPPRFEDIRPSLVIIRSDEGSGSGFVVMLDGRKYILTNRHVVEGAAQPVFQMVDGERVAPVRAEIADGQDLMRFTLPETNALPALPVAEVAPQMDEAIMVYGDSAGQGAITKLPGKIIGVGPEVVEVSADFVPGNSGSPILSAEGKVLGVATYVVQGVPVADWVTQGTRFAEARRFGVRMRDGMKWNPVSWKTFRAQADLLAAAEDLTGILFVALSCWQQYPGTENAPVVLAAYAKDGKNSPDRHPLIAPFDEFLDAYTGYFQARGRLSENSITVKQARGRLENAFRAVPAQAIAALKRTAWVNADMAKSAKERADVLALLGQEVQKAMDSPRFFQYPVFNGSLTASGNR